MFLSLGNQASGDEIYKYHKVVCIPEINYLEITSISSEAFLSQDLQKKYGLIGDASCMVNDKNVEVTFEVEPRSTGHCGIDDTFRVTLKENNKEFYTIRGFGDNCHSAIPSLIAYDGNRIHSCTKLQNGSARLCNIIEKANK